MTTNFGRVLQQNTGKQIVRVAGLALPVNVHPHHGRCQVAAVGRKGDMVVLHAHRRRTVGIFRSDDLTEQLNSLHDVSIIFKHIVVGHGERLFENIHTSGSRWVNVERSDDTFGTSRYWSTRRNTGLDRFQLVRSQVADGESAVLDVCKVLNSRSFQFRTKQLRGFIPLGLVFEKVREAFTILAVAQQIRRTQTAPRIGCVGSVRNGPGVCDFSIRVVVVVFVVVRLAIVVLPRKVGSSGTSTTLSMKPQSVVMPSKTCSKARLNAPAATFLLNSSGSWNDLKCSILKETRMGACHPSFWFFLPASSAANSATGSRTVAWRRAWVKDKSPTERKRESFMVWF